MFNLDRNVMSGNGPFESSFNGSLGSSFDSSFASPYDYTTGFCYTNQPVIDIRETPSKYSKVVTQSYFSERVFVDFETEGGFHIKTSDGYSGYVEGRSFLYHRLEPYQTDLKVDRLKAHIYSQKDVEYGPTMSLPFGARLKLLDDQDPRWLKVACPNHGQSYIQRGDVISDSMELQVGDKGALPELSQKFLGLPYTWGGRTSFGYDCSGFVQMLYSQIGIQLERDAGQQIKDDRFRDIELSEIEPGDLIFFGKTDQNITHVGMCLDNAGDDEGVQGVKRFIHATVQENMPWIRISLLSDFQWSGLEGSSCPFRVARQLIK